MGAYIAWLGARFHAFFFFSNISFFLRLELFLNMEFFSISFSPTPVFLLDSKVFSVRMVKKVEVGKIFRSPKEEKRISWENVPNPKKEIKKLF